MAHPDHQNQLSALKRIEGQIRGVQKMIDERKYCIDILTQIAAIKGALDRVEEVILRRHLEPCVQSAMVHGDETERNTKLDEIIQLIHRTRKA